MIDDRAYLEYILECIVNVEELSAQGRDAFLAAKHDKAAVLYYMHTLAEAAQRLSDSAKAAHPEIDWPNIAGFRNRIVHGYLETNMRLVWQIIVSDLPVLKAAIIDLLAGLENNEGE
jgi:uncharacterized protein with HEPN domain